MRFVLLSAILSGLLSTVMTQDALVNQCFSHASEGRYEGCFVDSSDRILDQVLEVSDKNSVSYCLMFCAERNYRYAGVQYYKECFCGDVIKRQENRDDSECNTKCSGSQEMCGGGWRISVYRTEGILPSSQESPQEGIYKGCFVDSSDRILDRAFEVSNHNSVEYCREHCADLNFALAGVQYYKECFCGDVMKREDKKDDSECNTKCSGSNEMCGGGWRISVYSTEGTLPSSQEDSQEGIYEGCFVDSSDRILDQAFEVSDQNSVEYCIEYCADLNFALAGVQYYKECFCGDVMKRKDKKDDSECNTKCSGSNEMCGGGWRISVYSTEGSLPNSQEDSQEGIYEGCFVDSSDRILDQAFEVSDQNSVEYCIEYCAYLNFALAGVQYYKECFCGDVMKRKDKKDDSECNTKCSGSNEMCGGGWRISVYSTEGTLPSSQEDSQEGIYEGCFVDSSDRILDQAFEVSDQNSVEYCIEYCADLNFALAGVQYHKECFCGDVMKRKDKKDDSECNTKCSGSNEMCGGGWRISVYRTDGNSLEEETGSTFMLPSNGCNECSCTWSGYTYEVLCESTACPQLHCPESLYQMSEGECCPTCKPSCYVNDQIGYVEKGMTYPTEDPCETCSCIGEGQTACAMMACEPCAHGYIKDVTEGTCCGQCKYCPDKCPKLPCKRKNQFQDEGMCCPECMCRYKDGYVTPGPVGEKCDGCECVDGKITCSPVQCLSTTKPECVDPVKGDDCCYTCPNGETCRHPKKKSIVMRQGKLYRVKKDVCMCSPNFWYPYAFCTKIKVTGVDTDIVAEWSLPIE